MSAEKKRFQTLDVAGIRCRADFGDANIVMQEGLRNIELAKLACYLACIKSLLLQVQQRQVRARDSQQVRVQYATSKPSLMSRCGVDPDQTGYRMKG